MEPGLKVSVIAQQFSRYALARPKVLIHLGAIGRHDFLRPGRNGVGALNFLQPLQPTDALNFRKPDKVFLAKGPYQGTVGVFLNLGDDPKWAEILEKNSHLRSHPVEWFFNMRSENDWCIVLHAIVPTVWRQSDAVDSMIERIE